MLLKRVQGGFTLIELVIVITILGILAAFAVPRFILREAHVRSAATHDFAGSVRSAAALAHSLWREQGSRGDVAIEGAVITIANGYPTLVSIDDALAEYSGFTYSPSTGTWSQDGATIPADCRVTYMAPASPGTAPGVTVMTSGC